MSKSKGKIYAKNINPAQRAWLQNYMNATGFEPMFQEDIDSGAMSFSRASQENLDWFEQWSIDALHAADQPVPDPFVHYLGRTGSAPGVPDQYGAPCEHSSNNKLEFTGVAENVTCLACLAWMIRGGKNV